MNNSELIGEFLSELSKTEMLKVSLEAYRTDLGSLEEFLAEKSVTIMDKNSLIEYIDFLRNSFSNNTVIRKLNSFKMFYKYLNQKQMVSSSLLDSLKNFKQDFSIPEILTEEELEQLFKACEPSEKGKRDILVIKLLLKTGMQLNKVLDLNTDDVNEESVAFSKNGKKYLIKTDEELKSYIIQCKKSSICGEKKIFEGLTRQNFFARLKKYQKDAGIEREINPAMLRNTAVYGFIEEGTPMRELKEKLDYVNIGMTGIYKIRNKADIKRRYEKISIGDWDVSKLD